MPQHTYEHYSTLKEARERDREISFFHHGLFSGIYREHRGYVVDIVDPFKDGDDVEINKKRGSK